MSKRTPYQNPTRLAPEGHVTAWQADLLADADHSEKQAAEGPFYPERGITAESLRAYAAECRSKAANAAASLKADVGTPS